MARPLSEILFDIEDCNANLKDIDFEISQSGKATIEHYREKERISKKIAGLIKEIPI